MIFHIGDSHDWAEARASMNGEYRISTRGHRLEEVGFIHASTAEQVETVANAVFRGAHELVLLVIDPERVTSEIRYESAMVENQAAQFPHIYGPLNTDAVVETLAFDADGNGRFSIPKERLERL